MSIFAMQADAAKVKIQHVHPLCWWAGMKNPELQILIHGEGVGTQQVALKDAQGIEIKEVVTQENPNYLILYLDTKNAPAQKFTSSFLQTTLTSTEWSFLSLEKP